MNSSIYRCTIIPPYLLEAIARTTGRAGQCAERTLASDQRLRHARATVRTRPAAPVAQAGRARAAAGPQRTIHDAEQSENLPGAVVRTEGAEPVADPAVNEAYDGLGATWELFSQAYGRDSIDGAGLPLLATVHYGRDWDNAFWDGTQMVFGDGDGEFFHRFTASVDVIGHELTHGVTEHTAGLVYRGQSGALNESISDAFGACVRQRLLGQDAASADWLIGADLLTERVQGRALRDMAAPGTAYDDPNLGKDPQPGHFDDYVDTTQDNGGVHINSGIPNRAFVLAARGIGGTSWEGAGQVWYDVLTGDIAADCDFATFAALTIAAAGRRFGDDSAQQRAVSAAWAEVGVIQGAPVDPAEPDPGTPPAGPTAPTAQTSVTVVRSGGFTGVRRERSVRLGELPDADARAWGDLLSGTLDELSAQAPAGRPDAFNYRVECVDCAVDVDLPEPSLPDPVRDLFRRTLAD